MEIKPIKSDHDYQRMLKEIDALMDARPNTATGDRLDVLVTLAQAWEEKHHAIEAPDPVEAIRFAMEQRDHPCFNPDCMACSRAASS